MFVAAIYDSFDSKKFDEVSELVADAAESYAILEERTEKELLKKLPSYILSKRHELSDSSWQYFDKAFSRFCKEKLARLSLHAEKRDLLKRVYEIIQISKRKFTMMPKELSPIRMVGPAKEKGMPLQQIVIAESDIHEKAFVTLWNSKFVEAQEGSIDVSYLDKNVFTIFRNVIEKQKYPWKMADGIFFGALHQFTEQFGFNALQKKIQDSVMDTIDFTSRVVKQQFSDVQQKNLQLYIQSLDTATTLSGADEQIVTLYYSHLLGAPSEKNLEKYNEVIDSFTSSSSSSLSSLSSLSSTRNSVVGNCLRKYIQANPEKK